MLEGSGTTAHAALKLNNQDGGQRRFGFLEMMDYAESITAERVRRIMAGYQDNGTWVPGLGGGFDFYNVSDHPLFDDDGNIDGSVGVDAIRRYIAWSEGMPMEALVSIDNPV